MSKAPPARLKVRPLPPAIARAVRTEMTRTRTPGVAVGIWHRGRAYGQGFGVTNVGAPAPVDQNTLFQIGSTGMRLVERGDIDLEAPIRRYIRDFRLRDADVARRVTMRHLLTHTGGWAGDLFVDTGRGDDALARVVEAVRKAPQLTPLGEAWHYNNAGFYIAGRVVEIVTGLPYEKAIGELLLVPLGMTNSVHLPEELLPLRVAIGHIEKKGKQMPQPWWGWRSTAPAGGLVSDVVDQLRWAQFHLGDGRAPNGVRLLKRSTLTDMQREHAKAGALADAVGWSWLLEDVGGKRLVSHGGTTIGQLSTFTMVPSEELAVTTLTNSTSGRSLNRAIVARVLETYAGVKRATPKLGARPRAELAPYEGRYVDGFEQIAITLDAAGGRLRGTLEALVEGETDLPTVRIALVGPDRAVHDRDIYAGLRAEFLRNGSGRVAFLRLGGRLYRRKAAPSGSKAKKRK